MTSPAERDAFLPGTFPAGFAWSTATAAYQIEGAYNEDGRGMSTWDTFSHTPGKCFEGHTGDVACDSYHKYETDVQLMKNMGTTHYRFSISWPRIMPDGTMATYNQKGVDYYNRVIDCLLAAGIKPMVTLFHWDLPQTLQDRGGFTNPDFAGWFLEYARVCFDKFGDRVKYWITFNEPICTCYLGYGNGEHAPGIKDPINSPFKAAHNLLRAHARAYRAYCAEFKQQQKGECGITLNADWSEPKDPNSPEDQAAAERSMQAKLGWFANPIFGPDGDYPQDLKDQYKALSWGLGMPQSILPEFTAEEKALNKGASDFFGLNHYTTRLLSPSTEPLGATSSAAMIGVQEDIDPTWTRGQSCWLYVVPWGLRRLLGWISRTYGRPPIYVTENGISDGSGDLNDTARVDYYRRYINEVLKAIKLDDCDVRGYTAWSLLDNYEWAMGYSERFGLHHVDYNDPERKRTPKASALFYAKVIKDNGFPDDALP